MDIDMDWRHLFAPHILDRGFGYYISDAVEDMEISDEKISAKVEGTETYEVEIDLEDGEIADMYCSCPYAADGSNCKHMAAVLYEWEKEGESPAERAGGGASNGDRAEENILFAEVYTAKGQKQKEEAVYKLVENADISVVRSFLTSALMEDRQRLLRFYTIVQGEASQEDVQRYMEQVDNIVMRYYGRERFIDYYKASDFIGELDDVLSEDVRRMLDNGEYGNAFMLMNHIFVLLGEVDMDDSDGGTAMLAEEIYQLWLELLEKTDAQEKREMFQWFTSHLDGSIIDYLEEYVEQIIMEEFREEEYAPEKFAFIEGKIREAERQKDGWSGQYTYGKWALYYLNLLEQQGGNREKILEFCRAHWENSSVRRYYIDKCMKEKNYDLALKALEESMVLDREYRGLLADYVNKKKDIYLRLGDQEAYKKQLWEQALSYEAGNLEVYRELKSQYTQEEWKEKREELFAGLPEYAHMEPLYKEEELYDRLLAAVTNSSGIYRLLEYEDVLKKDYPKEILDKYRMELEKMAYHTSNRKTYREMAGLLRRMKKIEGGPATVSEIVQDWKSRYKNRPAMMEEIRKI